MMYNQKLAVAIKARGKILREFKDAVYIPFASEYTILVKNLNSVRVRFRVHVDGTNATEGIWLVVNPNSELELERFVVAGNMNQGNRFKFIEKTDAVSNYRGDKVDDGLIRIEYQFEQQASKIEPVQDQMYRPFNDYTWYRDRYILNDRTPLIGGRPDIYCSTASPLRTFSADPPTAISQNFVGNIVEAKYCANSTPVDGCLSAAGITVPGSISEQKFTSTPTLKIDGQTHTMIIRLLGEIETGEPVKKAVTVKSKVKCITCGTVSKATSKFCPNCGTSTVLTEVRHVAEKELKLFDQMMQGREKSTKSPKFITGYKEGFFIGRSQKSHQIDDTKRDQWTLGFIQGYKDGKGKKKQLYK